MSILGQLSFDAPCQISFILILNIDVHKLHENENSLLLNKFDFRRELYIHIPLTSTTKCLNVITLHDV